MDVFVEEGYDIPEEVISVVKSLPDTVTIEPSTSILQLIGIDPLLKLESFCKRGAADIYAKVEYMNPSGSIKDRMVAFAIEQAEKRGVLKKGDTIVESTSGNTGVAVAMVAAAKGYKSQLVMPDSTAEVKKKMMRAYGAELVFTPEKEGIAAVVKKGKKLSEQPKHWLLNQFENPDNPRSHLEIGKEVLKAMGKDGPGAFVAAIGTGGTLIGVGRALKSKNPNTKVVAVEPYKSPAFYNMFYGKKKRIGKGIPHKIEGIGEGFVPLILQKDIKIVDDVILVKDEEAFITMHKLIRQEGLFVGVSSGANVYAAMQVAEELGEGKRVVTVLPDTGMRYLDTEAFEGSKEKTRGR